MYVRMLLWLNLTLTHDHAGKVRDLPSKRPEKLSVARQRFFFLFLFLASGMSMGWLEGISATPGVWR